jgi:hypothetical protein
VWDLLIGTNKRMWQILDQASENGGSSLIIEERAGK